MRNAQHVTQRSNFRDAIAARRLNALANDKLAWDLFPGSTTFISRLQTNWRYRADFREEARDQTGGRRQTAALRVSHHSRSHAENYMV